MIIYIYVLIDPITNEIRYVGKTNNPKKRYNAHLDDTARKKYHTPQWIRGLLNKDKKPIMRIIDQADESNWMDKERHWIKSFRDQGARLTNLTDGGAGTAGCVATPAACMHRSINLKGTKLSAKARANQSQGRIGMKFSAEHRKHLSQRKQEFYDSQRGKDLADQYSRAYGVLTNEQVIEVWRLANAGLITHKVIAAQYGIPQSTVSEIKTNKRYKHVKRPPE